MLHRTKQTNEHKYNFKENNGGYYVFENSFCTLEKGYI